MREMVELPLPGGARLTLTRPQAVELVARWAGELGLALHGQLPDESGAIVLPDDHPLWAQHTGLDGHRDLPEWHAQEDLALAEAFYQPVSGKAKVFLDLLIEHPGRQLSVDEIVSLAGGTFAGSRSIAGAINGLHRSHQVSGRRYPFYWWEGRPTKYAMKPGVADLFATAKASVGE